MKRYFLILLMAIASMSCFGQSMHVETPDSVKQYIDTVFNIIRTKSLYRNSVNWITLRDSVDRKTQTAKTIQDVMPAIAYIFASIGDYHGGMHYDRVYGMKKPEIDIRSELTLGFRFASQIRIAQFGKTGYVMVPGNPFSGEAANRHAQQIQDSICKLYKTGVKNWIVDLRLNTGGNMHPMIAGLSGILEDGVLGYFIGPNGEKAAWKLQNGKALSGGAVTAQVTPGCPIQPGSKVAVLLSQITCSSGEIAAISFKGRENTRFFGENTSGYVSANESIFIDKKSMLVVAAWFEADRNNIVYKDFVRPDVPMVEGDNFYELKEDKKVQAAIKWLKSGKNSRKVRKKPAS